MSQIVSEIFPSNNGEVAVEGKSLERLFLVEGITYQDILVIDEVPIPGIPRLYERAPDAGNGLPPPRVWVSNIRWNQRSWDDTSETGKFEIVVQYSDDINGGTQPIPTSFIWVEQNVETGTKVENKRFDTLGKPLNSGAGFMEVKSHGQIVIKFRGTYTQVLAGRTQWNAAEGLLNDSMWRGFATNTLLYEGHSEQTAGARLTNVTMTWSINYRGHNPVEQEIDPETKLPVFPPDPFKPPKEVYFSTDYNDTFSTVPEVPIVV